MEVRVAQAAPAGFSADVLIVPVAKGDAPAGTAATVDATLGGLLADAMQRGEFKAGPGSVIGFPAGDAIAARRVCFVGVGEADKVDAEALRRAAGKGVRAVNQAKLASAAFAPLSDDAPFGPLPPAEGAEALATGSELGAYRFLEYKTEEESSAPNTLENVTILVPAGTDQGAASSGANYGATVGRATGYAADLANHPSAVVTPTRLAEDALAMAEELDLTVTVLDKEQMIAQNMGGMIGVSQGSVEPPKFVIMEYKGAEGAPVVMVGKSITFDTGGISIKPSAGMEDMKGDMGGGAAVIATMRAVAELGLPIHVVGILTAAENMPSGTATNPGDVLHMHNGLTVEVINTDAEGRLVLADGLSYGDKTYQPRLLLDIATLTGACVVALGTHAIGLLGTSEDAKRTLTDVGQESGERVWELPLWDDYAEDLKSDIADIKNTGGRAAGTITAACFLKRFTGDAPWVHLDIAGAAWANKATDYLPKGMRGTGVRLLTGMLRRLSEG